MTQRLSPRPVRNHLRALLLTTLALGAAVPAAQAADPILPLSQVTTGMVGEARTVVRGTDIVTFPVTVIDVQRSGDAPGGALILIRAEGPLIEQTGGIAQGMSGSPVYVRGADGVQRVIGAVAYGTGDQANVIGGVTPIEQMLAVASGPRALSRAAIDGLRRPLRVVASRAAAQRQQRRAPGTRALYPLERWSVAGLDRRLASALGSRLGTDGVQVSTIGPRTIRPPVAIVPGASMTALAMGGDLVFGATGTTTYVDGTTVLGFGHPFTGGGASRLLLGDAWIFTTIAAPIGGGSYKLAEPGVTQGLIVGDHRDGVVGRLGPAPAIKVHSKAVDTRRQQTSDLSVDLVVDPALTPAIADAVQLEPLLRVRDGIPSGTVTVNVRITSQAAPPIVYRNVFAAAGDVSGISVGAVSRPLGVLLNNSSRVIEPTRVEIDQTLDAEVRAARLIDARIVPARAKPGAKVKLVLTLQRFRDSRRRVVVPFRLPAGLEPGPRAFKIVPNAPGGFDAGSGDLLQALGASAGIGRSTLARTEALVSTEKAGGSRAGRVVRALRRSLRDRHDAVRVLGPDDPKDAPKADDGTTVDVAGTVIYSGSATARVRVIGRK